MLKQLVQNMMYLQEIVELKNALVRKYLASVVVQLVVLNQLLALQRELPVVKCVVEIEEFSLQMQRKM